MKHAFEIAWIAIRELVYEKVFYILLSFGALALLLGLALGQMTYGERAKLTLDFMLAAIELSMVLFSIFMGISLFQKELAMGSVSMVLSKPISRSSFLFGKFIGQLTVQFFVTLMMLGVTVLSCWGFEEVNYLAVSQSVTLIFLEICIVTAATYLFAVNAGGITAAIGSFGIFAIGHFVSSPTRKPTAMESESFFKVLLSFVPNFEVFNMKTIASYGVTISNQELVLASTYALLCTTLFLVGALLTFERKDIFT